MFKPECDLCGARTTKLRYIGKDKVACLECYKTHEAKLEELGVLTPTKLHEMAEKLKLEQKAGDEVI